MEVSLNCSSWLNAANMYTGATLPQETKDKLFVTSLENIEYSILLETEARTMKWGWLFRTYVQWHAIAFLLSELCVRTKGEAVERAWRALEATAGRWWFPLSDTSSYGKGQQGCLWRPLRKLLEKAKAARAKELALERASQALRNGQIAYNYSSFDHMGPPPVTSDQPSSEDLDRLLRPTAPRLGEVLMAERPSWPNSPALPDSPALPSAPSAFPSHAGDGSSMQKSMSGSNDSTSNGNSPGQDFHNLSTFGLDNVIRDVMEDMTYEGAAINNYSTFNPAPTTTNIASLAPQAPPLPTAAQAFPTNGGFGEMNNLPHPTFGDNMFSVPNMDFSTTSPLLDNNGQQTDSPVVDGGGIDWALWDDMVNQYGIEGQTNPANSGGPGHVGMVHWF